jgi:outer membrane protein OmpA-like peptidoglycan-associated protein
MHESEFAMKKSILTIAVAALLVAGCANMNNQQRGTMIGAAGGALAAAAIGKGSVWGVLAGAAIGGTAGNLIGRHMDEQAKELEQAVPTAEVNRVEEGINMTFQSGLMFAVNSSEISADYRDDLAAAATVFNKYPDTYILVEGHTDDTGTDEINVPLSERRAKAVSAFLVSQGVAPGRLEETWYGSSQPKYPNDSADNRSKNRRVELAIYANESMVAQAKAGGL